MRRQGERLPRRLLVASIHVPHDPKEPVVKHLSLYVIATVNTETTPRPSAARRPREKGRFFRAALLRPFRAPRLDSREAAA
jgi:hypothetical protein